MGHSLLWTRGFLALLIFLLLCSGTSVVAEEEALPLLLQENFEQGFRRWQTTDVEKSFWEIKQQNNSGEPNHVLRVLGPSTYQPPHRSPPSIALLPPFPQVPVCITLNFLSLARVAGRAGALLVRLDTGRIGVSLLRVQRTGYAKSFLKKLTTTLLDVSRATYVNVVFRKSQSVVFLARLDIFKEATMR